MLVVDMYHQYHSRLTRGCLACGSRGDDSSGERSHARAFLSGGWSGPSLSVCGLRSGAPWLPGYLTFRVVAELGALLDPDSLSGPLRDGSRALRWSSISSS